MGASYQCRMPSLEGRALPENMLLVSGWLNGMVELHEISDLGGLIVFCSLRIYAQQCVGLSSLQLYYYCYYYYWSFALMGIHLVPA